MISDVYTSTLVWGRGSLLLRLGDGPRADGAVLLVDAHGLDGHGRRHRRARARAANQHAVRRRRHDARLAAVTVLTVDLRRLLLREAPLLGDVLLHGTGEANIC